MTLRSRVITIIIIFALASYAIATTVVIWRLTDPLNREQHQYRREAAELQQKIADLEYMIENTDDPDVIRRIAEDILGLVSQDVIILTDAAGSQTIDD